MIVDAVQKWNHHTVLSLVGITTLIKTTPGVDAPIDVTLCKLSDQTSPVVASQWIP